MARKSKRKKERRAQKRADQHTQQVSSDVSNTATVNGRDGVASSDSSNGRDSSEIFVPEPPQAFNPDDWAGTDGEIGQFIVRETVNVLNAYEADPGRLNEDVAGERFTSRGGYANRQLVELVQNSADVLTGVRGRISIILTEKYLYCADNGSPIIPEGVNSLMRSHLSTKSGTNVIGRFGLGFKAVLAVTDSPEFFSRSGSFVFDRARSEKRIRERVPDAPRFPVLRLPEAVDPVAHSDGDANLRGLMSWATNIVRLPLKHDYDGRLSDQIKDFKPQCLFFMQGVDRLTLADYVTGEKQQDFTIRQIDGDEWQLNDGESSSRWKLFTREHELSAKAQDDYQTELEDGDKVKMSWAVPLERIRVLEQVGASGYFWTFFSTESSSLVRGILNTHWKTNEDRQNLLPGDYNDELIHEAAKLVAECLPKLWSQEEPSRHLDVLPRLSEAGDARYAEMLRNEIFRLLYGEQIIPDQSGELQRFDKIQYAPSEVTENRDLDKAAQRWESFDDRPTEWVHHSTFTPRTRWATVERLCDPEGRSRTREGGEGADRSSFDEWLEALVEGKSGVDAVEASKTAIQTAALIPDDIKPSDFLDEIALEELGEIVLTQDDIWVSLDSDDLFLPGDVEIDDSDIAEFTLVHPDLSSDEETVAALKELGVREISVEVQFEAIAKQAERTRNDRWSNFWKEHGKTFWQVSRSLDPTKSKDIILENMRYIPTYSRGMIFYELELKVLTLSGKWMPLASVLLPGKSVPDDGSRDDDVAVDMKFHSSDYELLKHLGVVGEPENLSLIFDRHYHWYVNWCVEEYQDYCYESVGQTPQRSSLRRSKDDDSEFIGHLKVLTRLSDEGKARYTEAALRLEETYEKWMMYHSSRRNFYPKKEFDSPMVWMLRQHGMIRTSQRIVALIDVIESPYEYQDALRWVDEHANADKIREAFGLPDPSAEDDELEAVGEEDPIPLIDEWPGLEEYLSSEQKKMRLVRCEKIITSAGLDSDKLTFVRGIDICLLNNDVSDDFSDLFELAFVYRALEFEIDIDQMKSILEVPARAEILESREKVRLQDSDAERLLMAVGEYELKRGLPQSLLDYMERDGNTLSDVEIAKLAISTYHTGVLKRYKHALRRLYPPQQWAGGHRIVEFVESLGLPVEWAGERNRKREPFEEVMGPYALGELHDYQKKIVDKLLRMLDPGPLDPDQRSGMISLPTGSGKTRVAVQGLVDAMREDVLDGGILWVADRDELCEQAVESWRQVWANEGIKTRPLRISRMWGNQREAPLPTSDLHVVVASIQKLHSKFSKKDPRYEFLRDFKLVVFDEAHRSIAPTFTSVRAEIGLAGDTDQFLLGLTATPYRGFNEIETRWLTNRYGRNRLDRGVFESDDGNEVIRELQGMQVLARANHATIEGSRLDLTSDEVEQTERARWLPRSAEERLAQDPDRTDRIIKAYQELVSDKDPDCPTLIFATSVDHAVTIAGALDSMGVKARAVSSSTDMTTRRRVVDEFRNGDIKVLVNYSVFREGFDAPKTRAIIVARPVYSPNLYFQMIGRGLRGVKNGGNDRCLILNVQDNIENFERKLAFTELDWLWDGD